MLGAWVVMTAVVAALPLPPTAPPPAWVEPVAIPAVPAGADGSSLQLLHDVQLRVGETEEHYRHAAWKVLTVDGVSEYAKHSFTWDPASERLTLHGVWIWRDGTRRVAWHPEDARVLQREADLIEDIYDGRLTFIVEVRDVRVGDVVEVATSITGRNPVFRGHFSTSQAPTWSEGVELSRFRLVWARAQPLHLATFGGLEAPAQSTEGGAQVYRWERRAQKAVRFELDVPPDVLQGAWVSFSDWKDWGEVARWAEQLFAVQGEGARFDALVTRFRALPEGERAAAIVRFVQDEVRYVGVELGPHSHQPHAPAWVLERGFGDCKDKALLLVTLLRAVGMEAWPVLVESTRGAALPQRLPGADAFDHAIVKVLLPGGPRFIDATRTSQRGALELRENPNFKWGLVVKGDTTALEEIPSPPPAEPTWELTQKWVSRPGKSATLVITTVARGHEAAALRSQVLGTTRAALTEQQEQKRERQLETELKSEGLTWEDDEAHERFTLVETWGVSHFWGTGERHFASIVVEADLVRGGEKERTLPFAVVHPLRVKETIVWESLDRLEPERFELTNRAVHHPAFELTVAQGITGHTLTLGWELRTLKDRVPPEELAAYRRAVDDARETFTYDIEEHGSPPARRQRVERPHEALYNLVGLGVLLVVAMALITWFSRSHDRWLDLKERWRALRFAEKQKAAPGELAANPAVVDSVEAGFRLFTSRACGQGHAWAPAAQSDTVRLGDERVTVLSRRCTGCAAREDRYVKLR